MSEPPDRRHRTFIQTSTDLGSLLEAMAEGRSSALRQFVRATQSGARRYASVYLRCDADQDDVLQDVYIAVWLRAARFDPERGSAMAWFITIVRNACIDRIRTASKSIFEPWDKEHDATDPTALQDAALSGKQSISILFQCLDQVQPHFSRALTEVYLRSCTHEEAAEHLSLPLGTMKAHVRRGLPALRRLVEDAERLGGALG